MRNVFESERERDNYYSKWSRVKRYEKRSSVGRPPSTVRATDFDRFREIHAFFRKKIDMRESNMCRAVYKVRNRGLISAIFTQLDDTATSLVPESIRSVPARSENYWRFENYNFTRYDARRLNQRLISMCWKIIKFPYLPFVMYFERINPVSCTYF